MTLTEVALAQRQECLTFLRAQEDAWSERLMLLKTERCAGNCGRHLCDAVVDERNMIRGILTTLRRRIAQWKQARARVLEAAAREPEPPVAQDATPLVPGYEPSVSESDPPPAELVGVGGWPGPTAEAWTSPGFTAWLRES